MRELKEREYRFKKDELACLENLRAPLAVYQFLNKRVVTRVLSAGFCDLFEFDKREEAYAVMTTDMYSTAHPDDVSRIADVAYRFATEDEKYEVVYRVKARKSGGYKIVHAIGEHVFTETGERLAYVWYTDEGTYTAEDAEQKTELSESFRSALREESMIRESYYDYLTGLPNMAHFFDLVEAGRKHARKKKETPAILFIDFNGMRFYNRRYGFAAGDKLLVGVAKVLANHFKSENCSRFGQDHFAVFTNDADLENTLRTVETECEAINNGMGIPLRIGIYLDKMGRVDAGTACDRARHACNALPHNTFVSSFCYFDDGMLAELENKQYIISNLDRAIAEKWIQVYYQPIVRAVNGRVCDEESLARWIDPVRGALQPADFVPVLEDAKLAYKLDLYVLEETLEKLRKQKESGLYLVPQSVNLSRTDFDVCDIVQEICTRVDAAGVDRSMISVEITESVVGSDFEFMRSQVEWFQKLGFEVWVDDFGSGYSTLDVLQHIHFDLIKLDMRFMERFGDRMENRIILTELVRMAIGLGMETICEGVETEEQVEFLREIGCTKLQGFNFCRPISLNKIVERYRTGTQIGFENPAESDYFATIGRVNLYDTSIIAGEEQRSNWHYFDSIPMALIETTAEDYRIVRCNSSYRDFMTRTFGIMLHGAKMKYADVKGPNGLGFLDAMRQCGLDGKRLIIDEEMANGSTVHAIVKRVAVNPVAGASALAVAVLAVMDKKKDNAGLTYASIAKALSTDYFDLYYVDLKTEDYIHYSSTAKLRDLTVEQHGRNFFSASLRDARERLHKDDYLFFANSFSKEKVVHAMDEQGAFTLTYRLLISGEPIYVNMKAVRMGTDDDHIIIGVNNVNAQMREQEALERIRMDRITYSRIMALSGDYVCIYTVDPDTDNYVEYSSTRDYEGLGIAKEGKDFFAESRENAKTVIAPEDAGGFLLAFTKENIMEEIHNKGRFSLQYHLLLDGVPTDVRLKAVLTEETEGARLIIGVKKADAI